MFTMIIIKEPFENMERRGRQSQKNLRYIQPFNRKVSGKVVSYQNRNYWKGANV